MADAVTSADVVVALASHNDARTVGGVVRALQAGLSRYCPSKTVQFVLADAHSGDGTRDAARDAVGPTLVEVEYERRRELGGLPYHGHPGRAAGLRAVFQTAQRLGAGGCAVVDASLLTVTPEWIERLVVPVLSDTFDHASPHYLRHANEGAITKSIVYPMFRTLYGVRMRQPAAGEFSCSGRLVSHYLEQDFWDTEQAAIGIDLRLAVLAVTGEFRVCEAALGTRGATSHGTPVDLSTTLSQVVGALFSDLEHRVDVWQRVRGSAVVPVVGTEPDVVPNAPALNVDALIESFRLGYRELRDIWTHVLPARTIIELRRLTEAPPDRFRFDDRLWAGIIYDFTLGYSMRVMPHDHLLRSLTPLYTGWLASFALQMKDATPDQVEERVEQVCLGFESEKRHLISRWRWPERMR